MARQGRLLWTGVGQDVPQLFGKPVPSAWASRERRVPSTRSTKARPYMATKLPETYSLLARH